MIEFLQQNWAAVFSILAVFFSPIVALAVSDRVSKNREKERRQYFVLSELMATRRSRLDLRHVSALNLIELEFYHDLKIRGAYKAYVENLSESPPSDESGWRSLLDKRGHLFAELLMEIAKKLNYQYDKSDLDRLGYSPEAHGQLGENQLINSSLLRDVLEGRRAIPIANFVQDQTLFPPAPQRIALEDKS